MIRTTLFKAEFANIDKVSDGVTEHYEYDNTPFAELNDKQKQELMESPALKKLFKDVQELIDAFSKVVPIIVDEVIPAINTLAENMENHRKQIEAEKAKEDDKAK